MSGPWTFHKSPELTEFIDGQHPVMKHQIKMNIEKLETRCGGMGIGAAKEPLVGHLEGDVYYLRADIDGYGFCRCFFYRDGPTSFRGFFGINKKTNKIRNHDKKLALKKYQEIKNIKRNP